MDDMKEFEDDPDWLRAKEEAERKDPNYWPKRNIEAIEIHLRYGLQTLKLLGFLVVALLSAILWRLW